METNEEIKALKARIEYLEIVNALMARAMRRTRLYVAHCAEVEKSRNGLRHNSHMEAIDAALASYSTLDNFNNALHEYAVKERERW